MMIGVFSLICGIYKVYLAEIFSDPEKTFRCCACNRLYKYFKTLKFHQENECGIAPRFFCMFEGCNYKAKQKGNLKKHLTSVHRKTAISIF